VAESYTGVRVVEVRPELIDQLYKEKHIDIDFDQRRKFYQNEYVVLKDITGASQSALTRVTGSRLSLLKLDKDLCISGVKPRNKEQWMAFDALLDESIKVVVLTGTAGSGKTLASTACAFHHLEKKHYKRVVFTRIMTQVGKHDLGILPGDVDEKFNPYLKNYMCNFELLFDKKKSSIDDILQQYDVEFLPFQLIRGASFINTLLIADECQTLDVLEMLTLGTRMSEGSKIVILGDLKQRDEKIAREKTGIFRFVNSEQAKQSSIVASIELIKSERGETASLFASIFEEQ